MQPKAHPATPALAIDNVSKRYTQWQRGSRVSDIVENLLRPKKREIAALDGVSLTVNRGEFVAYAGANGAGKSTTIKILSGILRPSTGQVRVLGMDPARERIALMRRIGVLFGQRTELWWDQPVLTSYQWKKNVWDIPDAVFTQKLAQVTELLDLPELLHTFARELSLGQRMRADLGMLLLHDPEVLFLDEPTLGLDVLAKRHMIEFLRRINREQGVTIVVTSHDMDDLEEMARRIILLSQGHIAFDGDFDALRRLRGSLCRVRVTTGEQAPPTAPPGLQFVSSEGGTHEFCYDGAQVSMGALLSSLAGIAGVQDVEIRRAPIEEVIANLYLSWKQ